MLDWIAILVLSFLFGIVVIIGVVAIIALYITAKNMNKDK